MKMKALVIERPNNAIVKDINIPEIKPDEIKIQVKASGICGTDLHIYRGDYLGEYPIVPGHEFSGIVVETGAEVTRFKSGDHVAVEPNISCGNCRQCFSNRQNFCENWTAVGVTRSGGMAEYAVVPENAAFNTGDLSFEHGSLIEPLSCVLHGIRRLGITMGDEVLIMGAGPIGLLLSMTAQLQGASRIFQLDKNQKRLEQARKCGAYSVYSSLEEIDKKDFDSVIEATGVNFLMEGSINYVRQSGKILFFGVPHKDSVINVPMFKMFQEELTLLTSYTSVRNSLQAINLLSSGKIDADSIISHRLPLNGFLTGIDYLERGEEGVYKILICPEC